MRERAGTAAPAANCRNRRREVLRADVDGGNKLVIQSIRSTATHF
jgi:hypothetical protein